MFRKRKMKELLKWIIFPGMNLHARQRFYWMPAQFGDEVGKGKKVLDAGCGNGMLCYRVWQRGADVMGISIKQNEVDDCDRVFHQQLGIDKSRLNFANINLYKLDAESHQFDAIICTEVLEHIVDDKSICAKFFQLLKPGGVLHVTTPNANHPYNLSFPIDHEEKGGHVRPGYTDEMYRALLEPIGFEVKTVRGLGGKWRQTFDDLIKRTQERFGTFAGVPFFACALPLLALDSATPDVPFCLYVKAVKPDQ